MEKKAVVRVPATTANLGPGFDVLGMALNLFNTVELEETGVPGFQIEIAGEGIGILPCTEENLVVRAINTLFRQADYSSPGWKLRLGNKIPLQSGLGSSAAAIIGGLLAANAVAGSPLTDQEILNLAIAMEGHPDNVAAALLGGVVVVVKDDSNYVYTRFTPPEGLAVYAVVPGMTLSTQVARSVLPHSYPADDVVFNLGRVALLTVALREGKWDLLAAGVQDLLHQPYRSGLVPGFPEMQDAARDAGAYGAVLSGSGPTVIAFAPPDSSAGTAISGVFQAHGLRTDVWELWPSSQGAYVVE